MNCKWFIVISITLMILSLASVSASELDQSTAANSFLYDSVAVDDCDTDSSLYESLDIEDNVPELPSDNSCIDDDEGSSADEDIDDDAADEKEIPADADEDASADDENEDSNSDDDISDSDITDGDSIIRNMTKEVPKNYNDKPISNIRETSNTFSDLQNWIDLIPFKATLVLDRDYKAIEDKQISIIAKEVSIDGNGHTIDCAGLCRAFYVSNVYVEFRNLNIINGHIEGNNPLQHYVGAAFYNTDHGCTFENCNFTNNYAEDGAGAIYNAGSMFTIIRNCIFRSNTAGDGTAGAIISCKLWVYDSKFIDNSACDDSGATYSDYGDFFDCTFIGNSAGDYGGAIYTLIRTNVYRCLFQDNSAGDYGGAIYSFNQVNIEGSNFIGNSAGDYGGAIYANGTNINKEKDSSQCLFINNKALDDKGGAIYSDVYLYAYNALFTGNSALVDGGAIWSRAVEIDKCSFSLNRASGAVSKCYGGAVRAASLILANSRFYNNFAENHGGAVFTDTFASEVKNCTFYENQAKEDGGAVYINNENNVRFYICNFLGNQAGDQGGAIYLDSDSSHISLINNLISGNHANDGHVVYNKGYYDSICNNWWGAVNPSSDNNMLVEWKFWTSNINHVDSDPLRMVLELDYAPAYLGDVDRATAYFVKSDGSRFNDVLPIDDFLTISSNGLKTIYSGHTENSVFVDFFADKTGIYNIISELYGVKCIQLLVVFDSRVLSGSKVSEIFNAKANSHVAKDILPNIISINKKFDSNGRLNMHSIGFKLNGDSMYKQFGDFSAFNPMKSLNHQESRYDFNIVSRLLMVLSQFGL